MRDVYTGKHSKEWYDSIHIPKPREKESVAELQARKDKATLETYMKSGFSREESIILIEANKKGGK